MKLDLPFNAADSLTEITYLSSQAEAWKAQTIKYFQQKHLIELGKVSGQVVHDIPEIIYLA